MRMKFEYHAVLLAWEHAHPETALSQLAFLAAFLWRQTTSLDPFAILFFLTKEYTHIYWSVQTAARSVAAPKIHPMPANTIAGARFTKDEGVRCARRTSQIPPDWYNRHLHDRFFKLVSDSLLPSYSDNRFYSDCAVCIEQQWVRRVAACRVSLACPSVEATNTSDTDDMTQKTLTQ